MADKVPFLSKPYSAYHQRDMPREDEELTRVGPGTPGGEYLRRFWQPILLSHELKDLPRRIRILGEDLVAFRDKSGAAGLLEPYCAHRGVSLEFGLIADKGIRCCYHGWKFAADGTPLTGQAAAVSGEAVDVHAGAAIEGRPDDAILHMRELGDNVFYGG